MSRIYESGEYYQKVKESTNGLERERIEEEKWQRGEPFAESFSLKSLLPSTHNSHFADNFHRPYSPSRYGSLRLGDRLESQTMMRHCPVTYLDNEPVHSINSRRTSVFDTTTKFCNSRSLQPDALSRPGSPQVVIGAGEIINTEHGFTIELNVKHFRPNDIRVTLSGNTLTVVGDRVHDDNTAAQTLRRTFTRKYSIPEDVQLSSIFSYMTQSGVLLIRGSRKGWKETEISVHLAPTIEGLKRSSVMSVV